MNVPDIKIESRQAQVCELRTKGHSIAAISQELGVCERTVRRDLENISEEIKHQVLNKTGLDIIAEHLGRLEQLYTINLNSAQNASKITKSYFDENGQEKTISIHDPALVKHLEACRKIEESRVNLLIRLGIISRDVNTLNSSVSEKGNDKQFEFEEERTAEEIREDIEKLLKHGRRMS